MAECDEGFKDGNKSTYTHIYHSLMRINASHRYLIHFEKKKNTVSLFHTHISADLTGAHTTVQDGAIRGK